MGQPLLSVVPLFMLMGQLAFQADIRKNYLKMYTSGWGICLEDLSEDILGRDQFDFDQDDLVVRCPQKQRPVDHRMRSSNSLFQYFDFQIRSHQ